LQTDAAEAARSEGPISPKISSIDGMRWSRRRCMSGAGDRRPRSNGRGPLRLAYVMTEGAACPLHVWTSCALLRERSCCSTHDRGGNSVRREYEALSLLQHAARGREEHRPSRRTRSSDGVRASWAPRPVRVQRAFESRPVLDRPPIGSATAVPIACLRMIVSESRDGTAALFESQRRRR